MEKALDFSQTQRIVFLIDLHPLSTLQNPQPYLTSLLSTSQTLLTFPSLSSSFFTFKFFFSSLSPLLSSSKLRSLFGKSSPFVSFDRPSQTLISLSESLNSLSFFPQSSISSPKASFTASSLCQLMHDYIWEPRVEDLLGKPPNCEPIVRSNLILVFSPVSRSLKCLIDYLDAELDEELVGIDDADVLCKDFSRIFNPVNEGLVGRDIHCSWVDIDCEAETAVKDQTLMVFERGIKGLGWGFSSSDAINLGSALLPFGMIYPKIGCSLMNFYQTNCRNKGRAELSLTITDVSGKPLECNCCELELLNLKHLNRQQKHEDILGMWESSYSSGADCTEAKTSGGSQITKIGVKEVWKNIENLKLKDTFYDYCLLRGSSLEHRTDRTDDASGGFFVDKVLKMLCMETTEFTPGKPIWPVFLNFLYKNGYWALVSVSSGDNDSVMGILKPFSVHSALICISDRSTSDDNHDLVEFSSSLVEIVTEKNTEIPTVKVEVKEADGSTPETEALSHKKSLETQFGKKKSRRKNLSFLHNLSWSSFCEAVLSNSDMNLEDVYFGWESNNSKKMKFLKCWMKQTKKCSRCIQTKPNELKSHSVNEEEFKERLTASEQEHEQPVSSSFSTEEPSLSGPSNMIREVIPIPSSEIPEDFLNSISQKIQQGLESKEMDLGALAERLVESSIYWLCSKHEKEDTVMNRNPEEQVEDCGKSVFAEMLELLLRDPKYLTAKYKGCDPPSSASELGSSLYTSEDKVTEYELQILFRMEILRSKVEGIAESTKRRMVKQICLLLDDIQYHLGGGCFGDVSLDKYVGRIIKNRYSHCLEDVVNKIYSKMDLMLYDDDVQVSGSQVNSEDGGESGRQKLADIEMGENGSGSASTSASLPIKLNGSCSASRIETKDKEHQCSLQEARERREKASKKLSFTRRVQYLQRVWAPKQPKAMKGKTGSFRKLPKKKQGREARCDVVCETPMTGKEGSSLRKSNGSDKRMGYDTKSVSKALFQDE